ncbi:hypothetical protein ABI_45960 [Asticcacaulis biprosthecium C19]|uniref:Lipoprotein n=1 Tax=Asticcacaulis biprosthecium C19 TaxID=715226 RepID=F4QTU9_9CAUL|nr:hypothetical protein [Asticcacaulis biprosthecium]EGF89249.1 hypothetical protein ABI_45960 [Asticcacaulis biprosthecium C19]
MKKLIIVSLILGAAAGLAACGGGSSGGSTVVVTPPPPADSNVKFGAGFAAAFKADPNSTPAAVSASDVVPVDPAAKPTDL